ncbi:Protein of unknown function, partial [Cotesia congregata]
GVGLGGKKGEGYSKKKVIGNRGEKSTYKICFWNVAGVKNKEEDFWLWLRNWDIVVLFETWVNNKKWLDVRESWEKGFRWDIQEAVIPKGRGRASGGVLFGVKDGIEIGQRGKWDVDGWVELEIKFGVKWWWVVGMYINGDLNRKKELLSRWLDETWDKDVIIGGDVYARTGSLGGFKAVGVGIEGNSRKSKDKVINKDGKDLPPQKKIRIFSSFVRLFYVPRKGSLLYPFEDIISIYCILWGHLHSLGSVPELFFVLIYVYFGDMSLNHTFAVTDISRTYLQNMPFMDPML